MYKGGRIFLPARVNCNVQSAKDETVVGVIKHINFFFKCNPRLQPAHSHLALRDTLQDRVVSGFKIVIP